jgi:hypothetical protein
VLRLPIPFPMGSDVGGFFRRVDPLSRSQYPIKAARAFAILGKDQGKSSSVPVALYFVNLESGAAWVIRNHRGHEEKG